MITVQTIFDFLQQKAPLSLAEPWDNPGLLAGDGARPVRRVITALDVTPDVIRQAVADGAELIVAHHPVIFTPLHALPADHPAYLLAQHSLAALCWHTNLDVAAGGVADTLAAAFGLTGVTAADAYTRIGTLPRAMTPLELAGTVNRTLHTRVRGCCGAGPVRTLAVFGGALDENSLPRLLQADAMVFGECKHHVRLLLARSGKTIWEAGHFATEHAVSSVLAGWLREAFPELCVTVAEERAPFFTPDDPA